MKNTKFLCTSLSFLFVGMFTFLQTPTAEASFCGVAKNSSQLARTAYNSSSSDKKKYLPSGFTYVTSYSNSKYSGGDHAYLVTSHIPLPAPRKPGEKPKIVLKKACHYVFRGLNTSKISIKSQMEEIGKMTKQTTCYTETKKSMGKCSERIYNRYKTLRTGLIKSVQNLIKKGSCDYLRIHGHSLGGSMANLFAAELHLLDAKKFNTSFMRVYTYGSPRVFSSSDANKWHTKISVTRWVYADKAKVVKTVYQGDMIPELPVGGYAHVGQTYMIYRRRYVTKSDVYTYEKKSRQWLAKHGLGWKHDVAHYAEGISKGCK